MCYNHNFSQLYSLSFIFKGVRYSLSVILLSFCTYKCFIFIQLCVDWTLSSDWCSSCRLTRSDFWVVKCLVENACLLPFYVKYKLAGYKIPGLHFHFLRILWILLNCLLPFDTTAETLEVSLLVPLDVIQMTEEFFIFHV